MKEDWDQLAKDIGFVDEKDMLEQFYLGDNMSISEIASRLGTGTCTINRRLSLVGIEKRPRGGANNLANQKNKLFHLPQKLVMKGEMKYLAKLFGTSYNTLYKYRRSITGGKHAVLYNQPSEGAEPVFDTQ